MLADRLQRLGLNPREQRIATVAIVVLARSWCCSARRSSARSRSRTAEVEELGRA